MVKSYNIKIDGKIFTQCFIDIETPCQSAIIEFFQNEDKVYIVSSSSKIKNNSIYVKSETKIQCILTTSENVNCRISYFKNGQLDRHEVLDIEHKSLLPIKIYEVEQNKIEDKWMIKLSNENNEINLSILKHTNKPIFACLSDEQHEIVSTDWIFKLFPENNFIKIPKKLLSINKVGVFQLEQNKKIVVPNVFNKSLISNILELI